MWRCPVHGVVTKAWCMTVQDKETVRQYCLACVIERVVIPNASVLEPVTDPTVSLERPTGTIGTIPVEQDARVASHIAASYTVSVSHG